MICKKSNKIEQNQEKKDRAVQSNEVFKTGSLNHSATHPATVSQALGAGTDKNKLRIGPDISPFETFGAGWLWVSCTVERKVAAAQF